MFSFLSSTFLLSSSSHLLISSSQFSLSLLFHFASSLLMPLLPLPPPFLQQFLLFPPHPLIRFPSSFCLCLPMCLSCSSALPSCTWCLAFPPYPLDFGNSFCRMNRKPSPCLLSDPFALYAFLCAVSMLSEHSALLWWQFSVAGCVQEAWKGEIPTDSASCLPESCSWREIQLHWLPGLSLL